MPSRFLLVSLCIVFGTVEVQSQVLESRVVNITQGPVRGYKESENVFAFYSIPYATATERYKAPDSPPTWTEIFDAVDRDIICPQGPVSYVDVTTKVMQEDCLLANVIVPDTEERNLPVLVHIHGGAFMHEYGSNDKLTKLASTKKIIVVSFNYRLGIFGFLCLGTEKVPGNAGLKDQVALLRWVKQNIAFFGGNPNDVTISGCSAGAASVELLSVSHTTKDVDFAYSMLRAVKLHVEAGNSTIYLHMYSFIDNNTTPFPNTDIKGAVHCSQSHAVWDEDESNLTAEYLNMKSIMREIWGSFIISGKPVGDNSSLPLWPPADANRSPYMSLGTTIELKGPLLEARALLWDGIYEQYYSEPAPPTTDSAFVHKNICLVFILLAVNLLS